MNMAVASRGAAAIDLSGSRRRVPEHRESRGVDPWGRHAQVGCGRRI